MKRMHKRLLFLATVTAVVGWLVVSKISTGASDERKKKKKGGPSSVLVTTYEVRPQTIVDTHSAIGTLLPDESIDIKNETPGKVVDISFEEGDRVEKGEVLLRMRNGPLRARLNVKKRRRDLLETQVERQRQVLEKGGISQQQFDVTQNELEVLEAELDEIRAQISETTVRAPFSGITGLREVSPGAILTTGTKVARLNKLDPIEVEFSVPERYADRIERGDEVRFRVHATDEIHTATVSALEAGIETGNRVLPVRAKTDNPDHRLRPGAYAQVRFPLATVEDALVVPATAVVTSSNETALWASVDGKAEKRSVETGMRTEGYVQIKEGISAGDVVVTTGLQGLSPGAELEVDTSEDAMDVDAIGPDPERSGMQNKWFSEEPIEDELRPGSDNSERRNDDSANDPTPKEETDSNRSEEDSE